MELVPSIPITLDRPRWLRFDLPAIQRAEARLIAVHGESASIFEALSQLGRWHVTDLAILLWAALGRDDPDLTEAQVESLVHMGNLAECIRALQQCLTTQTSSAEPSNGHGETPGPFVGESTGFISGPGEELISASAIPTSGD